MTSKAESAVTDITSALDLSKKAAEEDAKSNFRSAYELYRKTVGCFLNAVFAIRQTCAPLLQRLLGLKVYGRDIDEELLCAGLPEMKCLHQRSLLALLLPPWCVRAVTVGAKARICDPSYVLGVDHAKARFNKIVAKSKAKGVSVALLLYGPHGSGKSLLIRSVLSSYNDRAVFIVNMEDFVAATTQYEGAKLVGMMLRNFKKHSGGILVLEGIDHLYTNRPGIAGAEIADMRVEMLSYMKQLKEKQEFPEVVVATATKPWRIEKSLLETFQMKLVLPVPTLQQRIELIKRELGYVRCPSFNESDIDDLASKTARYSGYQVVSILRLALAGNFQKLESIALKEDAERAEHVTKHDIKAVADIIQADMVEVDIRKYANFAVSICGVSPEAIRLSGYVPMDASRGSITAELPEGSNAATTKESPRGRKRSTSLVISPGSSETTVASSPSGDQATVDSSVSTAVSTPSKSSERRKSVSASIRSNAAASKANRRMSVAAPVASAAAKSALDRRPSQAAPITGQSDLQAATGRRKSVVGSASVSGAEPPTVDSPSPVSAPVTEADDFKASSKRRQSVSSKPA